MDKKEKITLVSKILNDEINKVTKSADNWHIYLDTVAKFWEYGFTDQLLIQAHKPNATICTTYDDWREKYGRTVTTGKTGVPLLYEINGRFSFKHIFDISDTKAFKKDVPIKLWQYSDAALNNLSAKSLDEYIQATSSRHLRNSNYVKNIVSNKENTYLEDLDELNIKVVFEEIVKESINYVVNKRCGFEPDYDDDFFRKVGDFNGRFLVSSLGTAVSNISKELLRNIEKAINAERSINYERTDGNEIRATENRNIGGNNSGGLRENIENSNRGGNALVHNAEQPDIRTGSRKLGLSAFDNNRGTGGVPAGNMGQGEAQLSEGNKTRFIRSTDDRRALGTSEGNRQESNGNGRKADNTNVQGGGDRRETETGKSDEVGRLGEQHKELRKGDNIQRNDIHLNDTAAGAGEKSPAFSYVETIETEVYSEPDENGRVKKLGNAKVGDVFEKLKTHLEENNLMPDEYFILSYKKENEELPEFTDIICNTNYGGSEGIYIDIYLRNGSDLTSFATGKTLGETILIDSIFSFRE